MKTGADIWQAFNPPTSSTLPHLLLPATHRLEEQQGCAFLPHDDPVLTNYPQSIDQSPGRVHRSGPAWQDKGHQDSPEGIPPAATSDYPVCESTHGWCGECQHKRQGCELINTTLIVSWHGQFWMSGIYPETVGGQVWMALGGWGGGRGRLWRSEVMKSADDGITRLLTVKHTPTPKIKFMYQRTDSKCWNAKNKLNEKKKKE